VGCLYRTTFYYFNFSIVESINRVKNNSAHIIQTTRQRNDAYTTDIIGMETMNETLGCDINQHPEECFSSATTPHRIAPWEMEYAALVPRFTGSISAISSALIIYVILRSETRLSSIYHRIMFGMSLADICGSIAMALTSLPMPSYMPNEEIFGYSWTGTRLGNEYTCNAQGFFVFFGLGCVLNYNAMLCVYYACAIAFTMRERNIKKYIEPLLHGIPLLSGLVFSVPPLFYDMYNPGISIYAVSAWCGPVSYPNECNVYSDIECIRGNSKMSKVVRIIIAFYIFYIFCVIFLSLGLVIWKVIQTDCMIKQIVKIYKKHGHRDMTKVLEKHRNTKAVVIQAVSYIIAFLLGVIPPLSVGFIGRNEGLVETASLFEKLTLVFLPLQGFFNFIIFVSFKVYNYHKVCHDVSICRVIGLLFCTSTHDPCLITGISGVMHEDDSIKVMQDEEIRPCQLYHNNEDVEMKDDSDGELWYRLGLINYNPKISNQTICGETCAAAQESPASEGLLLGDIPSDNCSQREEDMSLSAGELQNKDDQSCSNQSSSVLPFSSNNSFASDSLWCRNLSVDDDLVVENKAKKTYYNLK
jgi:hypothetical protein